MSVAEAAAVPSGEAQSGAAEAIHVENLHKKFGQLHVLKGVGGDAEPYWHPSDPNTLYYGFRNGGMQIMTLDVRNTGTQAFPFAAALHTYHLVDDMEAVRIDGVQAETLAITDKLDQVFERVAGAITFDTGADKMTLEQTGFNDAVVWNPGAVDAAALSDMEDEEYRRFVCIEPALLGPQDLEPGGTWRGTYRAVVHAG